MVLICFDICELDVTLTRSNKCYSITFIDDFSDYTLVYLVKNKSETLGMFKTFVNKIEKQFSKKINRFHSERGIEYESSLLNGFYKQHAICNPKSYK